MVSKLKLASLISTGLITIAIAPKIYNTIEAAVSSHVLMGPTLPAKCSPLTGDIFFKTVSIGPTGTLNYCSAVNTWSALANVAPAGTTIVLPGQSTGTTTLQADKTATGITTIPSFTDQGRLGSGRPYFCYGSIQGTLTGNGSLFSCPNGVPAKSLGSNGCLSYSFRYNVVAAGGGSPQIGVQFGTNTTLYFAIGSINSWVDIQNFNICNNGATNSQDAVNPIKFTDGVAPTIPHGTTQFAVDTTVDMTVGLTVGGGDGTSQVKLYYLLIK